MTIPTVPAVGRTALMTAAAREAESARDDRLFTDPWAGPLLDAYRRAAPSEQLTGRSGRSELWDFFRAYFPGRTPFLDAQVRDGVAAGARQVVLLAAGLDARAARLGLPPGVPVYELDSEPVLAFKSRVLAGTGLDVAHRVPVAADLAADWTDALLAAGFRPGTPTVWIVEGLLMYLDAAACDRLAAAVRYASAPGSRLAVEYFDRNPVPADIAEKDADDERALDAVLPLFSDGPRWEPSRWLASVGATPDVVTDVAAEVLAQGRDVPRIIDPARPGRLTIWLAAGAFGAG